MWVHKDSVREIRIRLADCSPVSANHMIDTTPKTLSIAWDF
jgi:hypothetical protein